MRDITRCAWHGPAWYSLVAIATAAFAVLMLPDHIMSGALHQAQPVSPTRTVRGLRLVGAETDGHRFHVPAPPGATIADGMEPILLLVMDGNRDGTMVLFDHDAHRMREGGSKCFEDGCAICHHMSMPLDRNTSCVECHRDMYEPTTIFSHTSHSQKLGGNDGCVRCHEPDKPKVGQDATPCIDCHADMIAQTSPFDHSEHVDFLDGQEGCGDCHVADANGGVTTTFAICVDCHEDPQFPPEMLIPPPGGGGMWKQAIGYRDAMHGLCISCHERRMRRRPDVYASQYARCDNCHDLGYSDEFRHLGPHAALPVTAGSN